MSGSKALDSGLFRVLKKSAAYCAAAVIILSGGVISASAANTDGAAGTAVVDEDSCESSLPQMTFKAETKFSNGNTHPFGYQTSKLKVRWDKVSVGLMSNDMTLKFNAGPSVLPASRRR